MAISSNEHQAPALGLRATMLMLGLLGGVLAACSSSSGEGSTSSSSSSSSGNPQGQTARYCQGVVADSFCAGPPKFSCKVASGQNLIGNGNGVACFIPPYSTGKNVSYDCRQYNQTTAPCKDNCWQCVSGAIQETCKPNGAASGAVCDDPAGVCFPSICVPQNPLLRGCDSPLSDVKGSCKCATSEIVFTKTFGCNMAKTCEQMCVTAIGNNDTTDGPYLGGGPADAGGGG